MDIYNEAIKSAMETLKQKGLSQAELTALLEQLKNTKINILLVGGTGVGKSSTISALLEKPSAKIGTGVNPETQVIDKYEYNNLVIWDSPGLGDSTENDAKYKKMLIEKMQETTPDGSALIDLVLLVLDGRIKDYKSSYELISEVIKPSLGEESAGRLLIGINQIDAIQNGLLWDKENNCPRPELVQFLEEKTASVKQRIFADSGLEVDTVCYSAGYRYSHAEQQPYNLAKLLDSIMGKLPEKKRAVILNDINENPAHFADNDGQGSYAENIREKAESGLLASFAEAAGGLAKEVGGQVYGVLNDLVRSETFKSALKEAVREVAIFGGKMAVKAVKESIKK